jgi:hypothetical protein
MGAAAGPLGMVTSLASIGMKAQAQMTQAEGTAAANEFQAYQLERSAREGELTAIQKGGVMAQKLADIMGDIRSTQAARGIDPTSPTGAAIESGNLQRGIDQINIVQQNIRRQAQADRDAAQYLHQASQFALDVGEQGMLTTWLGGIGPSLVSPGFGIGNMKLGGFGLG